MFTPEKFFEIFDYNKELQEAFTENSANFHSDREYVEDFLSISAPLEMEVSYYTENNGEWGYPRATLGIDLEITHDGIKRTFASVNDRAAEIFLQEIYKLV